MNIGEKIRKLRTAKLMTQTELAGAEITRNMLSQIENGNAMPSLSTVQYIAKRLNVSTGYLMADENDEQIYCKHNEISDIKRAYMSGDFRICRDMCAQAHGDDEIKLIHAECALELAIEEFNSGNLREACVCFDEAVEACSQTIYNTGHIVAVAGVYFTYMKLFSGTLESGVLDVDAVNVSPAMTNEFCIYWNVLQTESFDITSEDFLRLDSNGPYSMYIKARYEMGCGNYKEAYGLFYKILFGVAAVPQPVLYFVICDLEVCCKELDDYKGAYQYAGEKLSVLQKLLS